MSWFAYIRKGVIYIPTAAITTDGILVGVEPIETATFDDMGALKASVSKVIQRGRATIPPMTPKDFERDPLLEMAGVKSWSTFYKGTRQLGFMRGESGFEIFQLIPYGQGERGYKVNESTRIKLPGDMPLSAVVDRIVDEIQKFA